MVSLILAASENNVIGKDNKLPWRLPADMKHFVALTKGNVVIMGRKTYDSLKKPLSERVNIVITRQKNFHAEGTIVCSSLEAALKKGKEFAGKEIFIIGGSEIYRQSMGIADRIYLTRIHHHFDGDAYSPEINAREWRIISQEAHVADEKNIYPYTFLTYQR